MNNSKSRPLLAPEAASAYNIIVVGGGATGSHVCIQLAKLGLIGVIVFDADDVAEKNVNNQGFNANHIGMLKVDAIQDMVEAINPTSNWLYVNDMFHKGQKKYVQGKPTVIFMCLDKGRLEQWEWLKNQPSVVQIIETRIGKDEMVVYSIDLKNPEHKRIYPYHLPTREQEENPATAELSPCGDTISIISTVTMCASIAVNMLWAFLSKQSAPTVIQIGNFPSFGAVESIW